MTSAETLKTLSGATAIMQMPMTRALILASVARKYGYTVKRIASAGETYPHETDFTFQYRVKRGHVAMMIEWHGEKGQHGVPLKIYREADLQLNYYARKGKSSHHR